MPQATMTEKRNPLPVGDHLLCLISVEEKMQPSFNDPSQEAARWIWQFKAKTVDPETGDRYEFRQYTGPKYGNPRAGLTILLDQMVPDWTDEQKGAIDTDTILQTWYKARIRHEKPDAAGDPPKPRLVMIEPYKAQAKAAPVVEPVPAEKPRTYQRPEPAVAPIKVDDDFDPELDDPFAKDE